MPLPPLRRALNEASAFRVLTPILSALEGVGFNSYLDGVICPINVRGGRFVAPTLV